MKVAIVLGTRPEIIKMSPIIRECERRGSDHFIVHTGQHYSYEMDRIFFEELDLPHAKYNLDVGSGTHAEQTGRVMAGIEKAFMSERPDVVLVQGDTNTVLAGALVAAKLLIPIGHVEAGLRSYDRNMPEEINRVLTDHLSRYLFAPTQESVRNLAKEGITKGVHVTGNTVVDSVFQGREIAERKARALEDLGLRSKDYVLVTAHRQENVDSKDRLSALINGLENVQQRFGIPMLFLIHPRTQARLGTFGIEPRNIVLSKPRGFLDFLQLESNAKMIITDSGGVQEEACILGVPCVTARESTERPETIEVGGNMLSGVDPKRMLECAEKMFSKQGGWPNPFGDGHASKRIMDIVEEN